MNTAATSATTTRYVGNCQICEADQKLHNGLLVHHGYTRPGYGYIVGDCPGVHAVPYEVSCDLVKKHIMNLHKYVKDQKSYLVRLQAGEITELHVEDWSDEARRNRQRKLVKLVKLVAGTPDATKVDIRYGLRSRWENAVSSITANVESNIRHAGFDITRCEKRVATWKPAPIRTIEEEVAKQEADKASKKAEKDAVRAKRAAKKAATAAKQADLQARRRAAFDTFQAKIVAAAQLPIGHGREAATNVIQTERRLKKNEWMWHAEFDFGYSPETSEALLALGLGRMGHNNKVFFQN